MHELIETNGVPIRAWIGEAPCEEAAIRHLRDVAALPFVFGWVVAMPDLHRNRGSTVGSVIATRGAVIPAAAGEDAGCGVLAARTGLERDHLPRGLANVRAAIERAVPHGRTAGGGPGDAGAWAGAAPSRVLRRWQGLLPGYGRLTRAHPGARHRDPERQLGTLGTGGHFAELCLDEEDRVWFVVHSGSRGAGNRVAAHFTALARAGVAAAGVRLPGRDLAYLEEGTADHDAYLEAVEWAQDYARASRELMMEAVTDAVRREVRAIPRVDRTIDCPHNHVARETHLGEDVLVTRRGALRARAGDAGIVPGSMGARSFVVRGLGRPDSLESCAHAAGRAASPDGAAEAVMAAQADLVEVEHTLRQVVCVRR